MFWKLTLGGYSLNHPKTTSSCGKLLFPLNWPHPDPNEQFCQQLFILMTNKSLFVGGTKYYQPAWTPCRTAIKIWFLDSGVFLQVASGYKEIMNFKVGGWWSLAYFLTSIYGEVVERLLSCAHKNIYILYTQYDVCCWYENPTTHVRLLNPYVDGLNQNVPVFVLNNLALPPCVCC